MGWQMSRYTIEHDDKVLAFGYDHVCGEYLQIWQRPAGLDERKLQDQFGPDPDEVLVNEDSSTGYTRNRMLGLIAKHGFTLYELEKAQGRDFSQMALYGDIIGM